MPILGGKLGEISDLGSEKVRITYTLHFISMGSWTPVHFVSDKELD